MPVSAPTRSGASSVASYDRDALWQELLERELDERSLRAFVSDAWRFVDPAPFQDNWHVDVICEHLEAVSRGQIRDLIVNQPPRTQKSLTVAVFWPVWDWLAHPGRRFLFNSYAIDLSVRDAVRARRLIDSWWFQARWGDRFQLVGDQNVKSRYENDHGGYRLSSSVGGSNTGEGGDILAFDDPHNVKEGESDTKREGTVLWWNEVMPSRKNDPKTSARVVVQQRVHDRDVVGVSLAEGGWHHLCLPMEYEPKVYATGVSLPDGSEQQLSLGEACPVTGSPHDPRTVEGQLMWPERFPPEEVAKLRRQLGSYAYSAQYQQDPHPRTGAVFDPNWLRDLPRPLQRQTLTLVQAWDLNWSEKDTADYTVAATVGMDSLEQLFLLSILRDRFDGTEDPDDPDQPTKLDLAMAEHIIATRPQLVVVEIGAFKQAATHQLIRRVRKLLRGRYACPIVGVEVSTDKVMRARILEGPGQAGELYADRQAPWWPAFAAEASRFPLGEHDDQVDAYDLAVTAALEHLRKQQAIRDRMRQGGGSMRRSVGAPAVPQATKANPLLRGGR